MKLKYRQTYVTTIASPHQRNPAINAGSGRRAQRVRQKHQAGQQNAGSTKIGSLDGQMSTDQMKDTPRSP